MVKALDKEAYFWQPNGTRVRKQIFNREDINGVRSATPTTLTERLDAADFHTAFVVETDPEYHEPMAPIGDSADDLHHSGSNWLKRGYTGRLILPNSRNEIMAQKLSPRRARQALLEHLVEESERIGTIPCLSGYSYSAPGNRESTKVHLHYAVRGTELFRFSLQSGRKKDKIHVSRKSHSKKETPFYGASYDLVVPSRTQDDPYVFRFVSVPAENTNEQFVIWRRMHTEGHLGGRIIRTRHDGCEKKFYGEDTHRAPLDRRTFCDHEIAGQYALAQAIHEQEGFFPLQPAPWVSEAMFQFARKLRLNVAVEEVTLDDRGVKQRKKRAIRDFEMERFLWEWAIRHARERPLESRGKKVIDYDLGVVPVIP